MAVEVGDTEGLGVRVREGDAVGELVGVRVGENVGEFVLVYACVGDLELVGETENVGLGEGGAVAVNVFVG